MTNPRAQAPSDDQAGKLPLAVGLPLFALIALVGNEVGSLLRYPDIGAAILFPPYAALTAAIVVCRRRDCVWYIVVGSVAHFVTHWPQWPATWVLFADVANITRALCAAFLLRRLLGESMRLDSLRRLALFAIGAVLLAPAVGATIGAADVLAHGGSDTYWRPWVAWFVSNALTGLAILPGCIAAFDRVAAWRPLRVGRRRVIEAALLVVAIGVTCAVAVVGGGASQHLALPLYAPLLVLIWAALRFGAGGASGALTAVIWAAIWSVDRGAGPFLAPSPDANVFALQIFVVFTSASVLCLATIATARQDVVQLYRALLASLQDHVAILDASGVVIEANESWRLFAESPRSAPFQGIRVGESFVAAQRAAADQGHATAASLLSGVTSVLTRDRRRFELEYDYAHDGIRQSFVTTVEALERSDGGAVVTRSDVTMRRRAQIEIEEQRRELAHLARVSVLGQLSGAIAHELNQPLSAILSNAEAGRHLLRRQPTDVEELSAIFQDITVDDRRAADVIRRLRALLKRGERRVQAIDAHELVDEVLLLARTELLTRDVRTTTSVRPDVPLFPGDRVQLQQVLLNLILNACEAMGDTMASERRLIVTAEAAGTDVHIAVRDSGPGIPADLIERLFEPFVTTKADGLGLGLSISRSIVASHGGRLWAENHPEGGTTMHCQLPVMEPAHEPFARREPAPATLRKA